MYKIGPIFSLTLFLKLIEKFKYIGNLFYSGFISGQLGKHGRYPFFVYPVSLLGGRYIEIGDDFFTQPGLRIEVLDTYRGAKFSPKITIGDNVIVNDNCHIACINEISIGSNVLMASRVFITDHFHGNGSPDDCEVAPNKRSLYTKGKVIIEDNVWLGEGVTVMPGVRIGRGSTVGANSVVTKDVPPYSVVAGAPARLIRKVLDEKA